MGQTAARVSPIITTASTLPILLLLACSGDPAEDQKAPLGETSSPTPGGSPQGPSLGVLPDPTSPSTGSADATGSPSATTPTPGLPPTPAATPTANPPGGDSPSPSPVPPPATSGAPSAVPTPGEPTAGAGGGPSRPEPEPSAGSGGETAEPEPGAAGTPPMLDPGICDNNMRDGDETAIDCGGSCPSCPGYPSSTPDPEDETRSGCEPSGTGFMCPQAMVFSPSMKQAVYDDWGMDTPPFTYGVVGHDPDPGGVDGASASYSSTCCQCYQLVFERPSAGNESLPPPRPMIVQAFNTYAGGPTAFDIYMAGGGHGNFNGCTENGRQYTGYPDLGGDWTGGVRATRYGQCNTDMGYTEASVAADACQDYVRSECELLQASEPTQSISRQSCIEANRIDDHYHTNWEVMVQRVECPEALTQVTGCRLAPQGLPEADPAIQTPADAQQAGFRDGYHTTTMQDCCRPTCAWPTNVTGTTGGFSHFYVCDAEGTER